LITTAERTNGQPPARRGAPEPIIPEYLRTPNRASNAALAYLVVCTPPSFVLDDLESSVLVLLLRISL
jgi:hypothetical protein